MRSESAVIRAIVELSLWGPSDFSLIDVGASGGIHPAWDLFQPKFRAVGFDPLIDSMDAARADETRPGIIYETAFVGDTDPPCPPSPDPRPLNAIERSSSRAATDHTRYTTTHYQGGATGETTRRVRLDDYCAPGSVVDFLKIDTDNRDMDVLTGAARLLREDRQVLGLTVEASFDPGDVDGPHITRFDPWLRAAGFTLLDIRPHRYTRAALPGQWECDMPAQTTTGPVAWCDVLYCRDVAEPSYAERHGYVLTRERLWKLVALFDLVELPDCAAEVIQTHQALTTEAERTLILDLLVSAIGGTGSYTEYLARFRRDPARIRQTDQPAQNERIEGLLEERKRHRERIHALKSRNRLLRERLARRRLAKT